MKIPFVTIIISGVCIGCASAPRDPVEFSTADELLAAARHIRVGDTRNDVVFHLGWRKDQGLIDAAHASPDDGGGLLHPRLAFWRWHVYPVSLYVDFTDDDRVYRVRYSDDRKEPDGPYILVGPRHRSQSTGPHAPSSSS